MYLCYYSLVYVVRYMYNHVVMYKRIGAYIAKQQQA